MVGLASPAIAEDVCMGEQNTGGVCYNPDQSVYLGCFYLASDECTPVYVPTGGISRCWEGVEALDTSFCDNAPG